MPTAHDDDTPTTCPNCGQWQRWAEDCLNRCRHRGLAHEVMPCPYCGEDGHNGGCRAHERHDVRCL